MLGDKDSYIKTRANLWKKLNSSKNDSFKAWMLGRIAVAGTYMGESDDVEQALKHLKPLLKKCNKDEMSGWGWAYLASVNNEEYKNAKKAMLDAVADAPTEADKLWIHIMNMEAAATAGDQNTYDLIVNDMKTLTQKLSLVEAISQIPEKDWLAWGLAKVRKAAKILGREADAHELEQPTQIAIKNAELKNLKACVMMAEITSRSTNDLGLTTVMSRVHS
ncbi:MAG: hypothetical protein ABI597_00855 [Gammaproteobacteria bacterium]